LLSPHRVAREALNFLTCNNLGMAAMGVAPLRWTPARQD
jgi:hypothetical protein